MKRQVITGEGTPTPMAHYCQGVLAGDTLYAAGQIASDYKTGVPPEARQDPAFPYYGSDIQKQARYVLKNLRSVFQAAGMDMKDVVKSQVFITDLNDFFYFDQVWKEIFPSPPPRTTVEIRKLLVPGCKVEIDLWGAKGAKKILAGEGTPAPLAHYCQGVQAGDVLYVAGQIASDYKTGVPPGKDLKRQARYVLENLRAVLKAGGCDFKDVVKAQVFITDADDFRQFDEVWRELFPSPPPRTTVLVTGLLVPGCRIEIDLHAVLPKVERRVISTPNAVAPQAHYCQGMVVGETVYAAGQLAAGPRGGVAAEAKQDGAFPYYGSDIQKQTRYVLTNLAAIFKAAGCELKDVVKSQVFLTDLNDFYYFDQVWKEFFPSPPPRTTVECGGLLVPGCKVEVDLTAVLP
jgi:reactive intermediate/imine deaminase